MKTCWKRVEHKDENSMLVLICWCFQSAGVVDVMVILFQWWSHVVITKSPTLFIRFSKCSKYYFSDKMFSLWLQEVWSLRLLQNKIHNTLTLNHTEAGYCQVGKCGGGHIIWAIDLCKCAWAYFLEVTNQGRVLLKVVNLNVDVNVDIDVIWL